MIRRLVGLASFLAPAALAVGCRDVTRFTNFGDHYEGTITAGSFVRAGFPAATQLCLVLDGNHLQDAPGVISSTDGRFSASPLKPIPQIWHDPLSTFTFGEGRVENLLYIATPMVDGSAEPDVTVIVSLLQGGSIEVRLLRGAPPVGATDEGASLFGVFPLQRAGGPCSY